MLNMNFYYTLMKFSDIKEIIIALVNRIDL